MVFQRKSCRKSQKGVNDIIMKRKIQQCFYLHLFIYNVNSTRIRLIVILLCYICSIFSELTSNIKIHTAYTMWIIHILYFFLFYRFNKIIQALQSLPCAYSTDYDKQVVDH